MSHEEKTTLIQKYLRGDCSPEEIAQVYEWYDSFEQEPDPLLSLSEQQRSALEKGMLHQIKANIQSLEEDQTNPATDRKVLPLRTIWLSVAGIAAVLLLVLNIVHTSRQPTQPAKVNIIKEAEVRFANTTKTIRKQILPDSSVVWLSPNTHLVYPKRFAAHKREVQMVGEAFFEVTKDSKRPFIIYSGGIVTQVLGTSFNISAYPGAASTEVSVVTGKVSVRIPTKDTQPAGSRSTTATDKESSSVLLLPNQKVTYSKASNDLMKAEAGIPSSNRIWQKASVSFNNALVGEVIQELNKTFGINIRLSNEKLKNCVLKADFTDQNLAVILELLTISLEATYEINGKDILLKGNGCN